MGPINDTRYPQGNYGCVKNIWSESRYLNSKNFNLFHVAKLCQILRASSFCWTFSVASFLTSTPRRPTPTFLWRPPNTSRTWGPTPPMTSSRLSSLRTWMTFSWCFNLFFAPKISIVFFHKEFYSVVAVIVAVAVVVVVHNRRRHCRRTQSSISSAVSFKHQITEFFTAP